MTETQSPEIPVQGVKKESPLESTSSLRDRTIRPLIKRGQLLLAIAVLSTACAQAEKETGVTVTPLTPTAPAAYATIEDQMPSAQTPIVEIPTAQLPSSPVPTETVSTPETQTVFDNLRAKITSLESTEQQEFRVIIDKIEKADTALTELLNLVNTHKESDGTPTLIALQMAKFANIDPTSLYPSFSPEEGRRRIAQDEIFIIRDTQRLAQLKSELTVSDDPNKSAHLIRQFDQEFFQTYQNGFYLEIGTKIDSQEQWSLGDIEIDPNLPGPSQFRTIDDDKTQILEVLKSFPKIENVRIFITSGQTSKVIFYPYPQPLEVYIGHDVSQLEPKVLDELGSVFDIKLNYQRLAPYYSPDEIVRLLIERERAVEMYRDFPSIEKMFAPLDFDSLEYKIKAYPNSIFIGQSEESAGQLKEPLFAQYLQSPLLDQFAQESSGQPNPYFDWKSFAEGETDKIQKLKDSSPFFQVATEHLKSKSEYLKNWPVIASSGSAPLGSKILSEYYQRVVPTYLNVALTEAFAEGDPKLLQLLTPEQKQTSST